MERLEENLYPLGRKAGVLTDPVEFEMRDYTPVENYGGIWVKREDMCCNVERFSKARGFLMELEAAKSKGITQIGWEEAGDYRAAKNVAAICKHLNLNLTIWGKPIEKLPEEVQVISARRLDHITNFYKAKIVFYQRKYLVKIHWYEHKPQVEYMIPLGGDKKFMSFAVANEVRTTIGSNPFLLDIKNWVVCVSTGGLLSGLLKGMDDKIFTNDLKIYAVLIQDRKPTKISEIYKPHVNFIDKGWKYYDLSDVYPEEFPCNLQYDAKAWKWLIENRESLGKEVVFWNAGA